MFKVFEKNDKGLNGKEMGGGVVESLNWYENLEFVIVLICIFVCYFLIEFSLVNIFWICIYWIFILSRL